MHGALERSPVSLLVTRGRSCWKDTWNSPCLIINGYHQLGTAKLFSSPVAELEQENPKPR